MKKVLILALALVLLVGIVAHGTFGYFSDTETSTGNTFTAWVEEVVCAKFNVSDDVDDKVYKYDASGNPVGSFDLATVHPYHNAKPSGVASVGDYVYVLDQAGKQVYQYTCSGTLVDVSKTLKKQGPGGLGNPYGLAICDDDMWVVLWGQDFIMYHYSLSAAFSGSGNLPADLEIAPHAENTNPTGLACHGSYLYVLDSVDKKFYQYDPSDPDPPASAVISKELRGVGAYPAIGDPLQNPAGAMLDGTSLWVVDGGTNKMYEYDIGSLFPDVGTINANWEFPLDSANDDASGV